MMFLLSAVVVLAAVWVYLRWLQHEDKKAAAKYAAKYSRIAPRLGVIWPIPAGHKTPWRDKRKEMAS